MEDGVLFTKQAISTQEEIEILQNPPLKDAVATPPEQAFLFVADSSGKEGNVFKTCSLQLYFNCLFFCLSVIKYYIHVDDWRCDQYRWQNQGVTKLPRGVPVIRKMYFVADTTEGIPKEFQRNAYQLIGKQIHFVNIQALFYSVTMSKLQG